MTIENEIAKNPLFIDIAFVTVLGWSLPKHIADNILYYFYFSHYSSAHCGLFIYQWQDREKPGNIPNPQGKFVMCPVYIRMSASALIFIKSFFCKTKILCVAHSKNYIQFNAL